MECAAAVFGGDVEACEAQEVARRWMLSVVNDERFTCSGGRV